MINSSAFNCSAQPGEWSEVARLCRRICLLRERGEPIEAERLRTGALAAAVAERRKPTDTDESIAEQLDAIFAREAERVADAVVLAELLAAQMTERFSAAAPPGSSPSLVRKSHPPPAPSPRRPGADIADFIDDMIAQERAS